MLDTSSGGIWIYLPKDNLRAQMYWLPIRFVVALLSIIGGVAVYVAVETWVTNGMVLYELVIFVILLQVVVLVVYSLFRYFRSKWLG